MTSTQARSPSEEASVGSGKDMTGNAFLSLSAAIESKLPSTENTTPGSRRMTEFMNLPFEIRLMVYEEWMHIDPPIIAYGGLLQHTLLELSPRPAPPGCRLLHILFHTAPLIVMSDRELSHDLEAEMPFLQLHDQVCGRDRRWSLRLDFASIYDPKWMIDREDLLQDWESLKRRVLKEGIYGDTDSVRYMTCDQDWTAMLETRQNILVDNCRTVHLNVDLDDSLLVKDHVSEDLGYIVSAFVMMVMTVTISMIFVVITALYQAEFKVGPDNIVRVVVPESPAAVISGLAVGVLVSWMTFAMMPKGWNRAEEVEKFKALITPDEGGE
ncbi:hypothetical protein Slin15195_G077450 [Septoria linicola]|uniref:Uncharacterized protein n=1 Tax=Septoria linicola TaxID=215465 RepID=A0A9Q9AZ67_9PEZI|nr:hypothetical protein Slin15195_G077450 [Septoria linicola]